MMITTGFMQSVVWTLALVFAMSTAGEITNDVQSKADEPNRCLKDSITAKFCETCATISENDITSDQCCTELDKYYECQDQRRQKRDVSSLRDSDTNAGSIYHTLSNLRISGRARPFLGKRAPRYMLGKRLRNNFLGKRAESVDFVDTIPLLDYLEQVENEEQEKRSLLGKKARPFLGKRESELDSGDILNGLSDDLDEDKRARRPFLGKRTTRPFLGKRGRRPFLGKRDYWMDEPSIYDEADEDMEKRGMRPFLGKRGMRPFLGKREYDVDFSADDNDDVKRRARYMLGKREAVQSFKDDLSSARR